MSDTRMPKTAHITRLFRTATPEQIDTAVNWYADAHEVASALAVKNGVWIGTAAGIIAACSPMLSWGANVNLAARLMKEGGLTSGYLKSNLAKANRILAGEVPLDVLGGDKVRAFYLGIFHAGRTTAVCIDRHAWSLAVNHRYAEGNIPTLKGKRYAAAQEAYTRAARILSIEYGRDLTPPMVQSVTWVLWRAKFWAEGAFDNFDAEL